MSTTLDDLTSFQIINRSGVADDMASAQMKLITAVAEHFVRLGNDPEAIFEAVQRDYFDHVLTGIPTASDRVRRYKLDDVKNAMSTERFRTLVKAERGSPMPKRGPAPSGAQGT